MIHGRSRAKVFQFSRHWTTDQARLVAYLHQYRWQAANADLIDSAALLDRFVQIDWRLLQIQSRFSQVT